MRISKVYTRTGDGGETSLVGGTRVSKADPRVEAYGEVDELNSVIGLARAHLPASQLPDSKVDDVLSRVQNDLFTLGTDLAAPNSMKVPRIDDQLIAGLEELSDAFNNELEPLREFILPGGSTAGATLHVARTVARRAERKAVALQASEDINVKAIMYLNRLSDLLFILSRVVNKHAGVPEKEADFSKRIKKD